MLNLIPVFVFIFVVEIKANNDYKQLNNSCTRITPLAGVSLNDVVGSGQGLFDVHYWTSSWKRLPGTTRCPMMKIERKSNKYNMAFTSQLNVADKKGHLRAFVLVENPRRKGEIEIFDAQTGSLDGVMVIALSHKTQAYGLVLCPSKNGQQPIDGMVVVRQGFDDVRVADQLYNQLKTMVDSPFNKIRDSAAC